MTCGGFKGYRYRDDERIFDTHAPIVCDSCASCAYSASFPSMPPPIGSTCSTASASPSSVPSGLNILIGFTGQISIGHAAFLAVGAYTTAVLEAKLGLPFYLAIPAAALVTAVFGLLFGLPSLRLKGLYLAIATLAAHFITTYVIIHWEEHDRGSLGPSGSDAYPLRPGAGFGRTDLLT